jgi:hypothetical protein
MPVGSISQHHYHCVISLGICVDAKKDILMYINIARLEAVTGLGIYDTMQ